MTYSGAFFPAFASANNLTAPSRSSFTSFSSPFLPTFSFPLSLFPHDLSPLPNQHITTKPSTKSKVLSTYPQLPSLVTQVIHTYSQVYPLNNCFQESFCFRPTALVGNIVFSLWKDCR